MTGIPYLTETWNPITGCSGRGCKARCWARDMVRRFPAIHTSQRDPTDERPIMSFGDVVFHPDRLSKPLHWRKPRVVGVCFMGDMFDEEVKDEWIARVWCEMHHHALKHEFIILTKQPGQMAEWYSKCGSGGGLGWITHNNTEPENAYNGTGIIVGTDKTWPLPNVWNGVSITDQEDADRMIPDLLRVPGHKWISLEPMMGKIDLQSSWRLGLFWLDKISLMVVGCHSNPRRYPCPEGWIDSIVDQCQQAGVSVYVKQVDIGGKCVRDIDRFPPNLRVREI